MPNFDRSGPQGEGPRTGRATGRCRPRADEDSNGRCRGSGRGRGGGQGNRWGHGGGQGNRWGRGDGRGRGWGRGGGLGRGRSWADDDTQSVDEQARLTERKQALEAELAATDTRLEQLSADAPEAVRDEDER